jgi:Flp pilus assembly protein TadG
MRGMKGLELPINVLIIVAVALIVLLAVVAMYFSGFSPFTTAIGLEGVKNDACRRLVQENRCKAETKDIAIQGFDANRDGNNNVGTSWDFDDNAAYACDATTGGGNDNLAALCDCYYSVGSEGQCKVMCGCPGYTSS